MDIVMSGFVLSNSRVIVVFPAPDGEDKTYIKPRRFNSDTLFSDVYCCTLTIRYSLVKSFRVYVLCNRLLFKIAFKNKKIILNTAIGIFLLLNVM